MVWLTGGIFGIISWCCLWGLCSVKSYYHFPDKSRMVLNHSMATTNDIQEEEPPTTALEKQVKTLPATMERLTRQNRNLEEQLRQKNAAPDNPRAD